MFDEDYNPTEDDKGRYSTSAWGSSTHTFSPRVHSPPGHRDPYPAVDSGMRDFPGGAREAQPIDGPGQQLDPTLQAFLQGDDPWAGMQVRCLRTLQRQFAAPALPHLCKLRTALRHLACCARLRDYAATHDTPMRFRNVCAEIVGCGSRVRACVRVMSFAEIVYEAKCCPRCRAPSRWT